MKGDLARVQDALAVMEEVGAVVEEATRRKVEAASLEVERTSLLLEIRVTKDKISSFHSQAKKDKEVMEEDY